MNHPGHLSINDYTYTLPAERIAIRPLQERDLSKLLVYKNKEISEDIYINIGQYIPENSLLIFNNTRVINARLRFTKSTGGIIEILLLEPAFGEYSRTMSETESVQWKCMVGGASKWKQDPLYTSFTYKGRKAILGAALITKLKDAFIIEFSWSDNLSFAEVLEYAGDVPLPPYIKRQTEDDDKIRYQTIYAKHEGSVAAPTAGLHFTDTIFKKLKRRNIRSLFVTLHVGVGTFRPVKAEIMLQHDMHAEWIDVSLETIALLASDKFITAVGTTSVRTIETLYWMGVKVSIDLDIKEISIGQWEVYETTMSQIKMSRKESLEALMSWMKCRQTERLIASTQLMIAPGYEFKIANAIITNFHQPQSTLLLLIAAAVGKEWKTIYDYALHHDYRFLSYGDGNLILIDQG